MTVPVAAFVVTFAELIDAFELSETVFVVAVPTLPARPSEPPVAVRLIIVPVIGAPANEFKLPAATRLNVLPAPDAEVTVVVPALVPEMYTFWLALRALADRFGAFTTTGAPDRPIEPAVDVKLTVPVAAFVVTFAELIEAFEVRVTVSVEVVPTVPASPSAPVVAVSDMVVPVIAVPTLLFRLPAAVKLNMLPAPELEEIVVVPALLSWT